MRQVLDLGFRERFATLFSSGVLLVEVTIQILEDEMQLLFDQEHFLHFANVGVV